MKKLGLIVAALLLTIGAFAQIEQPVKWSYGAKKISATEAVVLLKATIQPGWHIYALDVAKGGPIKTSFVFTPSKDYALTGKVTGPQPKVKFDRNFKLNVGTFDKEVVFQQKIKLKSGTPVTVKGKLEYMVCNNVKCLAPEEIAFTIPVK